MDEENEDVDIDTDVDIMEVCTISSAIISFYSTHNFPFCI